MQYLAQRHWHSRVTRPEGGLVRARTTYLSATMEAEAGLDIDPETLTVTQARWTVFRRQGGRPVDIPVPGLTGLAAYFGAGPALKEALAGLAPEARELFADTVRGVIQSETFFTRERGFTSAKAYDDFWRETQRGSCRYYSNLDRISRTWAEHIADQERSEVLFNRFKATVGLRLPEGDLVITATLADSFHDVGLTLRVGGSPLTVLTAEGAVRRAPDAVCREAAPTVANLTGIDLARTDKRTLAALLGGPQGCVHLIDLADLCRKATDMETAGAGSPS